MINPDILAECANTVYEYKDLFQVGVYELSGASSFRIEGIEFPHLAVTADSGQVKYVILWCSDTFALEYRPGLSSQRYTSNGSFHIINKDTHGAALGGVKLQELPSDEQEFVDTLTRILKAFEIEPFVEKHSQDAKAALDEFLSVIDSHLSGQ